jgi:tetratricopeptide (TPR) repeat protein
MPLTVITNTPVTKVKKLKSAEAYFAEGMRIGSYHNTQGALECFEASTTLKPTFDDAYVEKAAVLRKLGDLRKAEQAARAALEINPKNLFALYNLWRAVDPENLSPKTKEAMEYIKASVPKAPNDYIAKAYVHLLEGDTLKAIEIYKAAAARFPGNQFIHYDLGSRLEDANRFAEAEAGYRIAKELDKEFFAAHVGLVGVLKDQGKYAEALALDKKALKSYGEIPDIHNSIATALLRISESEASLHTPRALASAQKHLTEALSHIKTAIDLAPESILYHTNHGMILHALGREVEAVVELSTAYSLYSRHRDDPAQHLSPENLQYLDGAFDEVGMQILEQMPALSAPLEQVPLLKVSKKESPDSLDSKLNDRLKAKNEAAAKLALEKQELMNKAFSHYSSSASSPHDSAHDSSDSSPQGSANSSIDSSALPAAAIISQIPGIKMSIDITKKDLDSLAKVREGREQITKDKTAEEYFHSFTKAFYNIYKIALTSSEGTFETRGVPTMPDHSKASFLPFSSANPAIPAWNMKHIAKDEEAATDIVYRVAVKVTLDPAMSARVHNKAKIAAVSKAWEVKYVAKAAELGEQEVATNYKKEHKTPLEKLAHHDALFLAQTFEHSNINPYNPPAKIADDVVTLMLGARLEVLDAF